MTSGDNKPTVTRAGYAADIDQGLRKHMLRVYNYMAGALAITGLVSYYVASNPAVFKALMTGPMMWLVILSPLAFVIALSFGINKMSFSTAQIVFWTYSAVMGMSLSAIFMIYTEASIARTFFITSGTFGAMSIYGYTTKRDLTGLGSFLFMGLIGLILASVVNMFIKSSAMTFVTSIIGVLIFVGLTAYDTQKIKSYYSELDGSEIAGKKALMGALALYLDFINLFLYLLRFFGDRK